LIVWFFSPPNLGFWISPFEIIRVFEYPLLLGLLLALLSASRVFATLLTIFQTYMRLVKLSAILTVLHNTSFGVMENQ